MMYEDMCQGGAATWHPRSVRAQRFHVLAARVRIREKKLERCEDGPDVAFSNLPTRLRWPACSMALHRDHCLLLEHDFHFAAVAAWMAKVRVGEEAYQHARRVHRRAGIGHHDGWWSYGSRWCSRLSVEADRAAGIPRSHADTFYEVVEPHLASPRSASATPAGCLGLGASVFRLDECDDSDAEDNFCPDVSELSSEQSLQHAVARCAGFLAPARDPTQTAVDGTEPELLVLAALEPTFRALLQALRESVMQTDLNLLEKDYVPILGSGKPNLSLGQGMLKTTVAGRIISALATTRLLLFMIVSLLSILRRLAPTLLRFWFAATLSMLIP